MFNIAVLGAGIVGVSTAVNIQKKLPGAKVRLISDRFDQDTTSWGAGGIFLPTTTRIQGLDEARLKKYAKDAWDQYSSIAMSELACETGIQVVSGYVLFKQEPQIPLYADYVYSFRKMTTEELERQKLSDYNYGFYVQTLVVTVKKYYPWLLESFLRNGGKTEQRKVSNMEEFVGKYDLVVNCTGLGSRELLNDRQMYPVRGQIVRVYAPWIKHFYYTDADTYILPNEDVIALGGCRQKDNYNLNNSNADTNSILKRCEKLVPAVKGARVDQIWTGLRPTRVPPRIEKETLRFPNGDLKVVHNYGHGSNGIILSWGSSLEALQLVISSLSSKSKL